MTMISPHDYCLLGSFTNSDKDFSVVNGYSALPNELLAAEKNVAEQDQFAAYTLNQVLCKSMLEKFNLQDVSWALPGKFASLYQEQLKRIERQLLYESLSYFSLSNDLFRKDLGILNHRLIPCGAEFVTPLSGLSRSLLVKDGWRQAAEFIRVISTCRGIKPFLELHMHPRFTTAFNPEGWIDTYENLADFLAENPSFLGVQSTSWFLDPVLEQVSPHLAYLRQVPERCGATMLYAGEDHCEHSGAFATSQTRRALYTAGRYHPKLFTRIWPRQQLLKRKWRSI